MKLRNFITICLCAILTAGLFSTQLDAKTTKKASSSSSSLSINTFCKSFKESGFKSGYTYRGNDVVASKLKGLGFSVSTKKQSMRAEICGDWQTWVATVYTCTKKTSSGTISITLTETDDVATITFPTQAAADAFVKSAKSIGYKAGGYNDFGYGTYYENPSDCYYNGANLLQSGKTVKIIHVSEC